MFQIDLKSRKSIYEQVVDNVKELIITGVLPMETKLPSVRELSKSLTVNPNTVQKAYRELENQGFIYTVNGRGCFVAERESGEIDEKRVNQIMEELNTLVRELMYMGISKETIIDAIYTTYGVSGGSAGAAEKRGTLKQGVVMHDAAFNGKEGDQ